ncbi:MAG: hypothetical protein A3B73_04430 [Omnitrophica WOR_2 bacterium RIFCSPHIGHO2_02_FULL_63_39]|nr:MAG: hypothetical protein A3B73_04430 [Omnitrophica WOR_2 bacterium RIFCSPHIGHO2_02_FULL_63_39]OGX48766.1 MAG: hypothetical protein A3G88_05940 [Omnitrophica WOR_2 bacterium RIFCSPLOWO2_12_FULL_63_16]
MELITEADDRRYYVHYLNAAPSNFLKFAGQPFVVLVYTDRDNFSQERLHALARYLIECNARYVVCAGDASERTHDIFDEIISHGHWDQKRGEAILTTWHAKETPEEIVFHFVNAAHPERSIPKIGLLLFDHADATAHRFVACIRKTPAQE